MLRRLILAFGLLMMLPGPAFGSDPSWPLGAPGDVLLGFGATYAAADGAGRTHQGVDIQADPGSPVVSCVSGTVTFAGRIPAGEGASTLAVTVRREDGLLVTCLPLTGLEVGKDDVVGPGEPLGALAESGDASSGRSHVHVSCREDGEYVDPAGILLPPAPATVSAPVESAAGETAGAAVPASGDGAAAPSDARVVPRESAPDSAPSPAPITEMVAIEGALRTDNTGVSQAPARLVTAHVDSRAVHAALDRYLTRAESVSRTHQRAISLPRPGAGALSGVLAFALAALVRTGYRHRKKSLSSASHRLGESEVAAAVGR